MSPSPPSLTSLEPGQLGALALGNRVIKAATFEGMCPDGHPTDALVEHHRAVVAGGTAMTTVAYASVSAEGRTYGHQLMMDTERATALRQLTDTVHDAGGAAAVQLGHCGYFASKAVIGGRPLGPSKVFNTYGLCSARPATVEDLTRVTEDFTRAAALAKDVGFDAIELHAGHGYLISQFLSPYTNRRKDDWGGSLDNRLRFPLQVLAAMREALGADYPLLVKMNVEDGFAKGLQTDEAVDVAKAFETGGATGLVLSGGFVSKTPLYMLRGNVPTREMVAVQDRRWRRVGLRLFGRFLVQEYPFEENFFCEPALRIREAVALPLVLAGGVCSAAGMERARQAGFEFLTLGRALVRDPEFVARLGRGEIDASDCDHCNRCIAEMDRGGLRCTTRDEELAAAQAAPES